MREVGIWWCLSSRTSSRVLRSSDGSVAHHGSGRLQSQLVLEIADASGTIYQPAQTVYDGLATFSGNNLSGSVGGGFYSTEVVPEPASLGLMGIVGVAGFFIRRHFWI